MIDSLTKDLLNPRKIIPHIADLLAMGKLPENMNRNPIAIEIHPTAKCNHRCLHCSYMERNENRASLSEAVMEKLIDSIIDMGIKAVYFSGGGEPAVYPGIDKYIKKLNEHGIEISIITNGTFLKESGIMDIANMLNYIAISVPSVTEEAFKKITGSEKISTVLSCAEDIKALHGDKSPIIGARVVVTDLISNEIMKIHDRLKALHYDYVLFKIVRDYEDRGIGINNDKALELKQMLGELGYIDSKFTNLNENLFDYREPVFLHEKCLINEMGLLANIDPEGYVFPNIVEIGNMDFCIGNLYESALYEMWHSNRHKKVKEASNKKWAERKCKNCRAINYNRIIYELFDSLPRDIDFFI